MFLTIHKRHQFLTVMRYPTYRIEDVNMDSIADVSGLRDLSYTVRPEMVLDRRKRLSFTWQEVYSIDPVNALKVCTLIHDCHQLPVVSNRLFYIHMEGMD